jgi:asparagine synthase (glutamine-hydrolysing)
MANDELPGAVGSAEHNTAPDGSNGPAEPFFRIRWDGRNHAYEGVSCMEFGRRIARVGAPPEGHFAGWSWNGVRLRLDTDRYGIYPLYYYNGRDEFGVSRSILALIANGAPTELDWDALAVFFRWGGLVGNDTPFAGIRILPPGGVLEWERGAVRLTAADIQPPALRMSRDSAIEGFVTAVAAAVADRELHKSPTGSTLLPLSGGRDSRHLLLRLVEDGFPAPRCLTVRYGRPNPLDESTVATAVAARARVTHRIVDPPRSMIRAEAVKNRAIGFTSLMHAWYLSVVETGRVSGVGTVYDGLQLLPFGHAGWSEGERMAWFESGQYERIARDWVSRSPLPFIRAPLRALVAEEQAIARLTRELERYGDWPNPLGGFLAMNRTRRSIGNQLFGLWPADVTVFCPFLDQRVFDHLLGLPAEITMTEEDFHSAALRCAFPEYADIPYADPVIPERVTRKDLATARALVWLLLRGGTGPLLDPRYILPRALRAAVDPRYAAEEARSIATITVYARGLGLCWKHPLR